MRNTLIYITLVILVLLSACGRRPHYVMNEEKMAGVLYDMQLAQAIYRNSSDFSTDERKDALMNGILKKYDITQAELDSSLLWYSDNIDIYNTINDSVASRLRVVSNAMMNEKSLSRNLSDYLILPVYSLNEKTPVMSFDIDSFRIKNLDLTKFYLRFDIQGLSKLQKAEAAVFFTYKDTLVKTVIPVTENTRYSFTKPHLADSLLKSISGYVHISNKVRGLSSDVLIYNVSYLDSLNQSAPQLEGVQGTAPASPESSGMKPDSNIGKTGDNKPESVSPPDAVEGRPAPPKADNKDLNNAPVTSRDKAGRSPVMRRSRQNKLPK